MAIAETNITSFTQYLEAVSRLTSSWYFPTGIRPWLRGQGDASKPPLPGVFRAGYKEHDLANTFKQRAGMFTNGRLPGSPAQWLSLMQHVGLPTRLLDWTDSPLAALYFALHSSNVGDAAVWLLDPIELNKLSGITNLPPSDEPPVSVSYAAAYFDPPQRPSMYPIALAPTQVHFRMAVQRGYFTIHGYDKRSFVAQFDNHHLATDGRLQKLVIPSNAKSSMWKELWLAGFRHTNLFPDLDGLATELRSTFGPQP